MKIDPYCYRRNCSPLNALFSNIYIGYVDIAGRSPAMGRQTSAGGENDIFDQNASISLATALTAAALLQTSR